MSLDKAIEHGKEKRKPYSGAKAIDRSCRNHGSCPWCKENRTFSDKKREPVSEDIETYRPVIYGTLDYMTGELQIDDWTREEE